MLASWALWATLLANPAPPAACGAMWTIVHKEGPDASPAELDARLQQEAPSMTPLERAHAHYSAGEHARFRHEKPRSVAFLEHARGLVTPHCPPGSPLHKALTWTLAEALRDAWLPEKAATHYESLLALVGPDGPVAEVIKYRSALGDVRRIQRNFVEAGVLQREALRLSEGHYGPDHAETAWAVARLALVLEEQGGSDAEAEALYRRALAIREATLTYPHGQRGRSLLNLGGFLLSLGRAEEALPLLRRALDEWRAVFGPKNATLLQPIDALVHCAVRLGRPEAAAEALRWKIDLLDAARTPPAGELESALGWLVEAELNTRAFDRAEQALARLEAIEFTQKPERPTAPGLRTRLGRARAGVTVEAVSLPLEADWIVVPRGLFRRGWRRDDWTLEVEVRPNASDLPRMDEAGVQALGAQHFRTTVENVHVRRFGRVWGAQAVGLDTRAEPPMGVLQVVVPFPSAVVFITVQLPAVEEQIMRGLNLLDHLARVARFVPPLRPK